MDIAKRFTENPLLTPKDVKPSIDGAVVACLLNPGVFCYDGKTYLVMRVAERMIQKDGHISTLIADSSQASGVKLVEFALDDPKLESEDPRTFIYDCEPYLTTLSHLRLASSTDGCSFSVDEKPSIIGAGELESFGVEDCRVAQIDDTYYLTYSAVSENGVGVALKTTKNWQKFEDYGLIFPPHNKDCAMFNEKIDGKFAALHRPVGVDIGGPFIWYSTSPDLVNWGQHKCLVRTRPGKWDSERIGAGASPIRTELGWLVIYHGCNENSRYCLGAMLLDIKDPTKVLARLDEPIMEPIAEYEQQGFFGNVVFTNGHIVDGDTITLYYGASDEVICGATMSISEILKMFNI